jgi:hypothetical protein
VTRAGESLEKGCKSSEARAISDGLEIFRDMYLYNVFKETGLQGTHIFTAKILNFQNAIAVLKNKIMPTVETTLRVRQEYL